MPPVNLYFTAEGQTAVRYRRTDGTVAERRVRFPAQLLVQPPDSAADVRPGCLDTPYAALFAAFRGIPLRPEGNWHLAKGGAFSPVFRAAFEALLKMLRRPPEERWCVRGEPGWFLQFGFREGRDYAMGALVLPCGTPAVLTFRSEDLIEALPPNVPFAEMDLSSVADGLPEQRATAQGWDTRLRLPIADCGGAMVRLFPRYDA